MKQFFIRSHIYVTDILSSNIGLHVPFCMFIRKVFLILFHKTLIKAAVLKYVCSVLTSLFGSGLTAKVKCFKFQLNNGCPEYTNRDICMYFPCPKRLLKSSECTG